MRFLVCYLFIFSAMVVVISGLPFSYGTKDYRQIRSPHHTVMVSGYYKKPLSYNPDYNPGGAMTAFITGDTVATNTYLGRNYNPVQDTEDLEAPLEDGITRNLYEAVPPPEVNEDPRGIGIQEEAVNTENSKSDRFPKRKPVKPSKEEDDEENEGSWPFQLGGKVPSYNAFFPIMFGGYRGSKTRESDVGYPGSATAIANSFSTGRGGVASSHATAYGDPYVSTLLRNGFTFKKKPATSAK